MTNNIRYRRNNEGKRQAAPTHHGATGLILHFTLLLAMALPWPASAHRGDLEDFDPCRVQVGEEKIHFAAYTPKFSGNKSFCRSVPKVGMTNLVFDYEGKKLRQASIEFEVTKEPEGTRVYYRPPEKSKSGTVDGTVDFSKFGPGQYQAHVTIVDESNKDNKLDTHIQFSVGIEGDESYDNLKNALLTILACVVIAVVSYKIARGKNNKSVA